MFILRNKPAVTLAIIAMTATLAYAHVTVRPMESPAGATQKYTMRVPTERNIPTVRIEIEFPDAVTVSSIEQKAGWKIEERKSASGKILGAVFTGSIPPRETAEFTFEARNPNEETTVSWKVIQIYEDGSQSAWVDASGRSPASVTFITKPANGPAR
jgi:uncharacterized protein YcnI